MASGHTAKIDYDAKKKVFFVKAGKQRFENKSANALFAQVRSIPGVGNIKYTGAATKELRRLNLI